MVLVETADLEIASPPSNAMKHFQKGVAVVILDYKTPPTDYLDTRKLSPIYPEKRFAFFKTVLTS